MRSCQLPQSGLLQHTYYPVLPFHRWVKWGSEVNLLKVQGSRIQLLESSPPTLLCLFNLRGLVGGRPRRVSTSHSRTHKPHADKVRKRPGAAQGESQGWASS